MKGIRLQQGDFFAVTKQYAAFSHRVKGTIQGGTSHIQHIRQFRQAAGQCECVFRIYRQAGEIYSQSRFGRAGGKRRNLAIQKTDSFRQITDVDFCRR